MSTSTYSVTPQHTHYDVVIIGGAMIGSSIAWFLTSNPDFDGRLLVIERDPDYEFASTSRTNSCVRQQFSTEINIKISQFTAEFVKNFVSYMGGGSDIPKLTLDAFGYMYLADNQEFADNLIACQQLQNRLGAGTQIMSVDEIASAYPFYHLDDILLGSHNLKDEGYFEGSTIFEWWRRMARQQGAEYLHNEVVDITLDTSGQQAQSVNLASGETISCGQLVNASGPYANQVAQLAGIQLPIEPRKRYTWIFSSAKPLDRKLPLTIDPSGIHLRQYGANGSNLYMAGSPPHPDPAVAFDDFSEDPHIFEDYVWPLIAHRIPQFDAIRIESSWAGHYAFNVLDQNAILGAHTEVTNFIFANGFSGHGLQQSPAVGRGIAELLLYGEYRSLDLSDFSFSRIQENRLLIEKAVI